MSTERSDTINTVNTAIDHDQGDNTNFKIIQTVLLYTLVGAAIGASIGGIIGMGAGSGPSALTLGIVGAAIGLLIGLIKSMIDTICQAKKAPTVPKYTPQFLYPASLTEQDDHATPMRRRRKSPTRVDLGPSNETPSEMTP